MKKTVKWILSALLFVFCGLLIFGEIAEVVRKKTGNASDMIHSFYEIEENTLDVLALGSSHAYSAFYPNILWKEYGLTSYAMSSHRQTPAFSYYLLKEALQYQKPKVVLLETYYFFFTGKYTDEETVRMTMDGMRLGKVKHEMIQDLFKELTWKEKAAYYIPFMMYHSRWSELKNYDFNTNPWRKGAILDYNVYQMSHPGTSEQLQEVCQLNQEYLNKIVQLCDENNIELVFYAAPYGHKDNEKGFRQKQGFNLWFEKYAEENSFDFFDYQKNEEAGIDFSADFRDEAHLNAHGAAKITKHLGSVLVRDYGLQSHKEDPAYASWEEDYQKYLAEVADMGQSVE